MLDALAMKKLNLAVSWLVFTWLPWIILTWYELTINITAIFHSVIWLDLCYQYATVWAHICWQTSCGTEIKCWSFWSVVEMPKNYLPSFLILHTHIAPLRILSACAQSHTTTLTKKFIYRFIIRLRPNLQFSSHQKFVSLISIVIQSECEWDEKKMNFVILRTPHSWERAGERQVTHKYPYILFQTNPIIIISSNLFLNIKISLWYFHNRSLQ